MERNAVLMTAIKHKSFYRTVLVNNALIIRELRVRVRRADLINVMIEQYY